MTPDQRTQYIEDCKILKEFAVTDLDQQVLDLAVEGMSQAEIADHLNVKYEAIRNRFKRLRKTASSRGWSPEHDRTKVVPETESIKGHSTLYGEDGEVKLQWVKTNRSNEEQLEIFREAIQALKEDLPKISVPRQTIEEAEEQLAVYPMGDPHLGLLALEEETGDEDYDVEKGVADLTAAMERLVKTAPPCKEALIVNLGDFYHSDLSDNKTARSGHTLDVSDRWFKVLKYGIAAMKSCIESALRYHEKVTVINAIGNHDDHSSLFLSVCLGQMYENNPHVTINMEPKGTHYYRYGENLIGVHHGHNIKADKLPLVMAAERKQDWGDTTFRMWLTGHIHHDTAKEYNGCKVETFRTLTAKDAYSAHHGYSSQRDMKCLVLDPRYGEVERHTVNVAMIR